MGGRDDGLGGRGAPWARLPGELATAVAPRVGSIRAEILRLIDAERGWTERVHDPKVRSDLEAVTAAVLARFLALIGTSAPTFTEPDRRLFRTLGAGEAREGRGLEELLAAYRIGTRVMYAGFARALAGIDPSPDAQVALGEAVFSLIDALQAESADGYASEIATHSGERERRLRRLADALFTADEDAVRSVAPQVGWPVPARVAVALAPLESLTDARGLPPAQGFLVERDGSAVAVLAGGPGLDATVDRLADFIGAGRADRPALRLGPTVPLLEARRSLVAANLVPDVEGARVLKAADRLPSLLVRSAPEVAGTLRAQVLAPLEGLRPAQRERLTRTLESWLRHWGQRAEVAAELTIHPQTVAYRVGQLRELFGDDLDDPDRRLELQLALLES